MIPLSVRTHCYSYLNIVHLLTKTRAISKADRQVLLNSNLNQSKILRIDLEKFELEDLDDLPFAIQLSSEVQILIKDYRESYDAIMIQILKQC